MPFSERKKYSAEHGTDGTFDSFRRNSVCFAGRTTLGIPFRAVQQKIKKIRIRSEPFRRGEKHTELFYQTTKRNKNFPSNLLPFAPSFPNLGMGYSETHGNPRKEHFFPRNNENLFRAYSGKFFRNRISMATLGRPPLA